LLTIIFLILFFAFFFALSSDAQKECDAKGLEHECIGFEECIGLMELMRMPEVPEQYLAFDSKILPIIKEYKVNDRFTFKIFGDVSLQSFYDSRQFFGISQDSIVYYPLPQRYDKRCLDIDDKDQFTMYGISNNTRILFFGPDVWGAKSSGRMDISVGGLGFIGSFIFFRVKLAYIKFAWNNEQTELRLGHFYHPIVSTNVYATTVSDNEGIGYDPFNRAAVVILTHKIDKIKLYLAAAKEYSSPSSRLATMPDLLFRAEMNVGNQLIGAGINYHAEVPRLYGSVQTAEGETKRYKNAEYVRSIYPFVYAKFKINPFEIKTRFSYLENASPYVILGAYGVTSINPQTDERTYTNIRTLSWWLEMIYHISSKVQPGIFTGLSKNIGASKKIVKSYVDAQGQEVSLLFVPEAITNASYMFVITPRVRFIIKSKFVIGMELEYSRAYFAREFDQEGWQNDFDDFGKVINGRPTSNTRLALVMNYLF